MHELLGKLRLVLQSWNLEIETIKFEGTCELCRLITREGAVCSYFDVPIEISDFDDYLKKSVTLKVSYLGIIYMC